jgi:hypothetical protein
MPASTKVHLVLYGAHQFQFDAIFAGPGLPDLVQKRGPLEIGIRLFFEQVWMNVTGSEEGDNPAFRSKALYKLKEARLTRSNCHAIGRKSFGIPAHASFRRAALHGVLVNRENHRTIR